MILQALDEYYKRKLADPDSQTAPEGWEWKEIPFLIIIDQEGNLKAIEDTREGEGKKKRAKTFLVPMGEKKTVGIKANLLWDNVEYVLGANPRGRNDIEKRHAAFINRIHTDLKHSIDSQPLKSILLFEGKDPLQQIDQLKACSTIWQEILANNAFITYKIEGESDIVIYTIRDQIQAQTENQIQGICLITGEKKALARLHPSIKGVRGTNTTGGSIVSFNLDAFKSFGKDQSFNAPISEENTFSYTTGLNMLLSKDSQNKTYSGDSTLVFWSQKRLASSFNLEENFSWYVSDPPKDDPDRGVRAIKSLFEAMQSGHLPTLDDNRFYILGLSPNAARIAIRFWRTGTVREFGEKIMKHFEDIAIEKGPKDPEFLTVNQLLRATALEYKMDNVPPNIAGCIMTSILDGTPYPISLLHQCIRRIRAEQRVSYPRAAILKGYLVRRYSFQGGLKMSLNRNNNNSGYLLGRLFAVLERIQENANPNINATIRDRFYGAASSSPIAVFSQLLKLKNHHLAKIENKGIKSFFEKEIGEIMDHMETLPRHLTLDEQATFAIGYYQQRQDFFKKKMQNISDEGGSPND